MSDDPKVVTRPVGEAGPSGGPRELVQILLEARRPFAGQEMAKWLFADLSERELGKLIDVAYRVSFQKEEGRYPRMTIVVPTARESELLRKAIFVFDPPVEVEVRTLHHLSPAIPPRPLALLVKSAPDGLVCMGIGRFETAGAMLPVDQTGLYEGSGGLVIEIRGPGDLSVREESKVYSLSAGRIRLQYDGNGTLKRLPQFTHMRDVVTKEIKDPTGRVLERAHSAVCDLWMYVLKNAVALAHGGAFGILPTDAELFDDLPEAIRQEITLAYPTTAPDLLAGVAQYVGTRWGRNQMQGPTIAHLVTEPARLAARVSTTDGFVLFNRNLKCLGFGAKVGFDEHIPRECVEVDDQLAPTGHLVGLWRSGTRHRAAYRLCANIPGALTFVVSQDGDLRIFFKPEGADGIRVTAPLEPVTQLFQGM